jgi:hypothetical protein
MNIPNNENDLMKRFYIDHMSENTCNLVTVYDMKFLLNELSLRFTI